MKFICRNCKKEYERYSIPQMVLRIMLKLKMFDDDYHINLCQPCLKDKIQYCTTNNSREHYAG